MKIDKQEKIIADYLRYQTNDKTNRTNEEIIQEQGGEDTNEIIADFEDGTYIYRSISHTCGSSHPYIVINYIDTNVMGNCKSTEIIFN